MEEIYENQRTDDKVYAGTLWGGPAFPMPIVGSAWMYACLDVYKRRGEKHFLLGKHIFPGLLLFPYVFQKLFEAVCGESAIFDTDGGYPQIFFKAEKPYGSEKNTSYLYLSELQTENPHSQGERKD